jgi:hypothetical protein
MRAGCHLDEFGDHRQEKSSRITIIITATGNAANAANAANSANSANATHAVALSPDRRMSD